jgi:hypothetical protein
VSGVTEPGLAIDALSVAPCVEGRDLLIELGATGKPDPDAAQAEHLLAEVVNLGVLGVTCFGEPRQVFEVLTRPCVASIRASLGDPFEWWRSHRFGVREADHGFHVAPVPCVHHEQGPLDVLLRHRPRSISRPEWFHAVEVLPSRLPS